MEQQFLPFAAAHLAPDSSQQPCGLPAHACKVCSQCWLEQIAVCYELMWSMTTIVSGAALQLSLGYAANVQGQQQFSPGNFFVTLNGPFILHNEDEVKT